MDVIRQIGIRITILVIVLIYGVLPALAAAIVGWIRDGYRIVVVLRPRSTDPVPSAVES